MNNQQLKQFAFGRKETLFLWFFVSIVFTVVQIQQSLRQGQLSLPPVYDDVQYFKDTTERLRIIYENGIAGLLKNYPANPTHAPLWSLIVLTGYLIFGIKDWAPAAVNGFLVFLCLVFFDYLARRLPMAWRSIPVTITLTWLIMGHLVIECRPDIFCGLLTASFVVLITEKPWLSASKNRHFIVGALVGVTLLTKPSFSFIAIILSVWTLTWASLTDIFIGGYRAKLSQVLIPQLRVFGIAFLIAIPHYIFAFPVIFNYLYSALFNQSNIWQKPLGKLRLSQNLLYYLTGQGGQMMMGKWFYFWLVILICTVAVISYRRDWGSMIRVPALSGAILLAYALFTLAGTKSPFIGAVISSFFLVTFVQMLVYLLESCQIITLNFLRKAIYLGIISLYVSSILTFQWPWPNDLVSAKPKSLAEMKYYYEFLDTLYKDIRKDSIDKNLINPNSVNKINIFMTAEGYWLNPNIWAYYMEKMGERGFDSNTSNLSVPSNFLSADLKLQINLIKKANYIIAFNEGNPDIIQWLPINQIQKDILSYIRQKPDIKLIRTYTNPYTRGKIFLYSKNPPLSALVENGDIINLRKAEYNAGEYLREGWSSSEEWGTWTDGKQASIEFRLAKNTTEYRQIEFKISEVLTTPNYPQQRILFSLNGNLIKTVTLNRENLSLPIIIPIPLPEKILKFDDVNTMTLNFPDAITPEKLGVSADTRFLGIGIQEIKLSQIKSKS